MNKQNPPLIPFLTIAGLFLIITMQCKKEADPPQPPVISTVAVSEISAASAKSGGTVSDDGGAPVTVRGVVWGTTDNPTVNSNSGITSDGSGIGAFISTLTGLTHASTYYVRAYATNSAGTSYGNQVQFSTNAIAATVATANIKDITHNSAVGGGNVTDDGGSPVSARGVVWNKTGNPTLDNKDGFTVDGNGKGEFTSTLTGLTHAATYYVRAYATNSEGTAYGSQKQFPTSTTTAFVTTAVINVFTDNSAVGGGDITDDGGAQVTTRGVVWNKTGNPTLSNKDGFTNDGAGKGIFTSNLTGLSPNTTYYVCAYAENSNGISYGNEVEFKTKNVTHGISCPGTPTVTDSDGNIYNTVLIGTQCWMKENLKTTRYSNGTSIDNPGADNTAWRNNTTGAYTWYNNDSYYKDLYGALYNWKAVSSPNGLCPSGWHVASNSEWETLVMYIFSVYENTTVAGNHLKSCRQVDSPAGGTCSVTSHPRWDANSSHYGQDIIGFSALPGGCKNYSGVFENVGKEGYWWTSSLYLTNFPWTKQLKYNSGTLWSSGQEIWLGYSVRCIKD